MTEDPPRSPGRTVPLGAPQPPGPTEAAGPREPAEQAEPAEPAEPAAEAEPTEPDWVRRRRLSAVFGDPLPDTTRDERGHPGEDAEAPAEEWLRAQVPPHHG